MAESGKGVVPVWYTAADTYPIKLLVHPDIQELVESGWITPTHIQLALTNKCNLLCPFCSYGKVDRELELTLAEVVELLDRFSVLGTSAITVTGGGEPTLHPDFNTIIKEAADTYGYALGLITNGTCLGQVTGKSFGSLVWCRVSCSDYWDYRVHAHHVRERVEDYPDVDWGLSYVVGGVGVFKLTNFLRCVDLANMTGMKYVRVVADLTDPETAMPMEAVKEMLDMNGVGDDLVIYQGRKNTTRGFKECWTSLVKPYIGADGGVYPCCGVQYAEEEVSYTTPVGMRMGKICDIVDIWNEQKPYDGSRCVRCHYHQSNQVLGLLMAGIDHADFI